MVQVSVGVRATMCLNPRDIIFIRQILSVKIFIIFIYIYK